MTFIPIVVPMPTPMPGGASMGMTIKNHDLILDTPAGYRWVISISTLVILPWRKLEMALWRENELVGVWTVRANRVAIQRRARRIVRRHMRILRGIA